MFSAFFRWIDSTFRDERAQQHGRITPTRALFFLPIITPLLALLIGPQYLDDAFITFRVARNFVDFGAPFYNPGVVAQASTTPLYTLILAAGYAITGLSPDVVDALLQPLCLGATLWLLSLIALQIRSLRAWWWLPGFFYGFHPILIVSIKGMEAYLYGVLLLLAVFAEQRRKPILLGAALGLCAVCRTEGGLFALCYVVYWVVNRHWFGDTSQRWKDLALSTVTGILTGLPFLLFVLWFFGDPIPTSVRGKVTQAGFVALHKFSYTLQYFLVGQYPTYNIWFIPLTVFALVIVPVVFWKRDGLFFREFGFPVLCGYALMALFWVADAPAFAWYLYPSVVVFTLIYAHTLVRFGAHCKKFFLAVSPVGIRLRHAYVLLMIPVILYAVTLRVMANGILLNFVRTGNMLFMSDVRYGEIAKMLWARYPNPNWRLGAPEIGNLGYFAPYPIIDFSGLASPELHSDLGKMSYYAMALKHQPELLVIPADPMAFERDPALRREFESAYRLLAEYRTPHLEPRFVYVRSDAESALRVSVD